MKYNKLSILIIICLFVALIPSVSGVAQILWTNTTLSAVTAVDTNNDGSILFIGTSDGNISAYDVTANITWNYVTNNTHTPRGIKKIVADSDGNLVWINEAHQAGYINSAGTVTANINRSDPINITDVAIKSDGAIWAISELTPPKLFIYDASGVLITYNDTIQFKNWTKIGFDVTNSQWLISANMTDNKTYFWNVSEWNGWLQYNPKYTGSKNASQIQVDSFPYRFFLNISPTVNESSITFHHTTSVSTITQVNNSYFNYNKTHDGTYFFWTKTGVLPNKSNTSDTQGLILNLSAVVGDDYHVVLRAGQANYTVYYGDPTYSYTCGTFVPNNTLISVNFTTAGSSSWTAPSGVTSINLSMAGGGGGGEAGIYTTSFVLAGGQGGYRSAVTTINNLGVNGGTAYTVVVGAGGTAGVVSGGDGGTGGTSSFNTSNTSAGGAGGSAANYSVGANGDTTTPGYPTASAGGTGVMFIDVDCNSNLNVGKAGGVGFGAGGGGGGGGGYNNGCSQSAYAANGGAGANGKVVISYYTRDAYALSTEFAIFSRDTKTALNQSSSKQYIGTILGISVPTDGGLAALVTDDDDPDVTTGAFFRQAVTAGGFGAYQMGYYGSTYGYWSGTPRDIKTSNAASFSIEARDSSAYVYDYGGLTKVQGLTGGTVRSVDIGVTSGVMIAYGGDEGKLYIGSREGSTSWYTYYTGAVGGVINALALSWDGNYVLVGRANSQVELYATNITVPVTPTITYVEASVRVYKDGSAYAGQTITVFSSSNPTDNSSWTPVTTIYTDSTGHSSFTTTSGTYYKFVVNAVGGTINGEGSAIWLSNSGSTIVNIYIVSASTPYEWNAYYVAATHNVTVVYSDTIVPVSTTVTIRDLKTNNLVLSQTFAATQSFTIEYHDTLENGTYQVTILMNRLGSTIRDQRIVSAPNLYNISIPVDNNIKYAISTIILMLIAGMFTYINAKRGAFAVVIIAALFIYFDLLPMGLMTIAMLAAVFAVISLFGARV